MIPQRLKDGMLPIAIITGCVFHSFFGSLSVLSPYLIFCMLLVSYCKIALRDLAITPMHGWLLVIQVGLSLLAYGVLLLFDEVLAQGTFICILAPTATAAVVITGMLGGNIASLVSFSLLSNMTIAFLAPLFFTLFGEQQDLNFFKALGEIFAQVGPLLILPFIVAIALQYTLPKVHDFLKNRQIVSFYLWALALAVAMGRTTNDLIEHGGGLEEILLAVFALLACLSQFYLGHKVGKHYHDPIAAGQGLGQKNTIIAIWMAQVYLHPLSAIGPAAYIIWQNCFNSWQLIEAHKAPKQKK